MKPNLDPDVGLDGPGPAPASPDPDPGPPIPPEVPPDDAPGPEIPTREDQQPGEVPAPKHAPGEPRRETALDRPSVSGAKRGESTIGEHQPN